MTSSSWTYYVMNIRIPYVISFHRWQMLLFSLKPVSFLLRYEGFRAGQYVRVTVSDMPCELVDLFDPHYPLVVGGVANLEHQMGLLQTRTKRHRFGYQTDIL